VALLTFVSTSRYASTANVELGESRYCLPSMVPLALDTVIVTTRPMTLTENGSFAFVQPPFKAVRATLQHVMHFGEIGLPRFRPRLQPPEIDSGTVSHPIGANQAARIRPLTRQAVLEAMTITSARQQSARTIEPILPAVLPPAANTVLKFQRTIRVEKPHADDCATDQILNALGRSGAMALHNARACRRRNGASDSQNSFTRLWTHGFLDILAQVMERSRLTSDTYRPII